MIKKIAIAIVVLIAGVLVYATTKPASLHIERSTTIQAPPDRIHPMVNDFHAWSAWSPYEKLDPGMTRTHSGAPAGRGAVYEWSGNSSVGQGRMEIIESTPSRIAIQLHFLSPMEAHNIAEFRFEPTGGATNVTWMMDGPNSYMGKVMSVFVDMDRMIGRDFESGLANLKTAAESGSAKPQGR